MQIVVSEHLLSAMRHHAGLSFGGAKASHVAEAMAFGLGHRTNASLRSWLASRPLDRPALASFDVDAAARRLAELGSSGHPQGFADAARLAFSSLTDSHGGRFAEIASALDRRMDNPVDGIVVFVRDDAVPERAALHLRLAASFQAMRDHDRDMADFLSEFLLDADAEMPFDGTSASRLSWGGGIYRGFRPRIGALVESMRLTWPSDLDLLSLEMRPQLVRRLGRPAMVVEGRSDNDGEIGIEDTGRQRTDGEGLIGACCLARLKSGAQKARIGEFALRARHAGDDLAAVCLAEVSFGGPRGAAGARRRLSEALALSPEGYQGETE